jgi:hypothetical protein
MSTLYSLLALSTLAVASQSAFSARAQAIPPMAGSASCSCSSGFIPVPVDATVLIDPSDPAGLNTTHTRRLQSTFQIFGVLCEPVSEHTEHGRG